MAKDPAFLFYPGDWLGGTITFNRSQKGAYMDLLMAQFNQVALTIEDIKEVLGSDFDSMWERKLKAKFEIESNGTLFFNNKLREEMIKRKNFCITRRENKIGKKVDSDNHMISHMNGHMSIHMENENENVNRTTKTTKRSRFIPPTLEEVKSYCLERKSHIDPETFFHTYESTKWIKANGLPVLNWKSTIVTWEKKQPRIISKGTPRKDEPMLNHRPNPKEQAAVSALIQETLKGRSI